MRKRRTELRTGPQACSRTPSHPQDSGQLILPPLCSPHTQHVTLDCADPAASPTSRPQCCAGRPSGAQAGAPSGAGWGRWGHCSGLTPCWWAACPERARLSWPRGGGGGVSGVGTSGQKSLHQKRNIRQSFPCCSGRCGACDTWSRADLGTVVRTGLRAHTHAHVTRTAEKRGGGTRPP